MVSELSSTAEVALLALFMHEQSNKGTDDAEERFFAWLNEVLTQVYASVCYYLRQTTVARRARRNCRLSRRRYTPMCFNRQSNACLLLYAPIFAIL